MDALRDNEMETRIVYTPARNQQISEVESFEPYCGARK